MRRAGSVNPLPDARMRIVAITAVRRPSVGVGEPHCTLDQPAPTFVVAALGEHAIERERRPQQALHALCDALLGGFDPTNVSYPPRFCS